MKTDYPILTVLKAGADALRLQVLLVLRMDSFTVLELCEILSVKQPALSHHLKILTMAGLVTARREGNTAFYRRASFESGGPIEALCKSIFESLEGLELDDSISTNIAQVKLQRSLRARDFFDKNSTAFRAHQELIALPKNYLPVVIEVLERTTLTKESIVLELGVGEGDFLEHLAECFPKVVALDISESMLEAAQRNISPSTAARVEYLHGDVQNAIAQGVRVSHIVCNMVLHHVPSPADIFEACANLLTPEGTLIVTDLCRHSQTWAIEKCGDMWLGFEPAELSGFAEQAGFVTKEDIFYGLKNGFQLQTKRFELSRNNVRVPAGTLSNG
jgi:2-polyprenyl-3-methyl-5-hydroxy-6-metoxy-1,4-benzoquinol methylase